MSTLTIAAESRVVAAHNVELRDLGNAAVLVGEKEEDQFGLSSTGRRIWLLLAEEDSVEAVVSRLAEEFDISAEECRDDVTSFLQELLALGLVQVAE